MTRPSDTVVLCEDNQTGTFIRRFLKRSGWDKKGRIRVRVHPKSKGAGDQYVREALPAEIREHRRRCNRLSVALIAAIDADTVEVADRRRQVDTECRNGGVDPPKPEERILIVVPKRNIETWLAYLRGEDVNETAVYGKYDKSERLCREQVKTLKEMCDRGQLERQPPHSLEQSCEDFTRFMTLIQ